MSYHHPYEIRHIPNGEFWIFTPQAHGGSIEYFRFVGPFKTREDAESGLKRLVKQPTWKYNDDGELIE